MASTKYKNKGPLYPHDQMSLNVYKITGGAAPTPAEIAAVSPVVIDPAPLMQGRQFLRELFLANGTVHLQAACLSRDGTACIPNGAMVVDTTERVMEAFVNQELAPHFYALGTFITINGLNRKTGSGKGGRPTDGDVHHRYVLIEHDDLALDRQLALLTCLALPIASIVASGNKSLHALVRVEAQSAKEYKEVTHDLYRCLAAFGFDGSNVNPSRLTRLPGTMRCNPGAERGQQRLLYLNPNPTPTPIIDRIKAAQETK